MVLLLSHIESLIRCPIFQARESGHSVFEARKISGRSCRAFSRSAWRFFSSSGSLCSCRPATTWTASHSGTQRSLHCQTAKELDPSGSAHSSPSGEFDQRVGRRSFGGTTSQRDSPWVEHTLDSNWRCNFNLCRIVWPRKRWRKLMGFWCRSRSARSSSQ